MKAMSGLKKECKRIKGEGYYLLQQGVKVPVRIFMNPQLFEECEEEVFQQVKAATEFPGVTDVVLTPDAHTGYVVPVGCVMATTGTLCQAPVGYDIGCGMALLTSDVPRERGLDDRLRRQFSEAVMERVGMGTGVGSGYRVDEDRFEEIVRTGANALGYNRNNSERDYIPVDDGWDIPYNPKTRGIGQLGSLGGGNHFIELQYDQHGHLAVMIHTGSRGFGHGLATHFIDIGRRRLRGRERGKGEKKISAEAVYFEPDDPHWNGYKNAVAAGANFAIANRLIIMEQVSRAFRRVFGQEPELLYEISHNLAQQERQPDGADAWVHRKGATRAFPAGHPALAGTRWEETGHPILIPGSMGTTSYVLYALPGAEKSLFSVNHGCGRRMSRRAARDSFSQSGVNRQMRELNVMVNAGGDVPIDESPGCYKDPSLVIDSVVAAGLARVALELNPIASLKGKD
jgi:tRNA-splicing ligase RtcB (3'-phosphate/5'-hydroxy nucleic acid ligase)